MSTEELRGPTIDSAEEDYMTVPRPTGEGGWSPRSRIPSAGRVTIANPPTRPAQRATLNTRPPPKFPAILAEPSDTEGSDSVDTRGRSRTGKGRKKLRRKRKGTRQRSVPPTGSNTSTGASSGVVKRAPLYHGSVASASSPRLLHKATSQGHGLGASMAGPGQDYPYGGGLGNMQQVAVSPRDNKRKPQPGPFDPLRSMVITHMGGKSTGNVAAITGGNLAQGNSTIPGARPHTAMGMSASMGTRAGHHTQSTPAGLASSGDGTQSLDFASLVPPPKGSKGPGARRPGTTPGRPSPRRVRSAPSVQMKVSHKLKMRSGTKPSFDNLLAGLAGALAIVDPDEVSPQDMLALHHSYMQRMCKCFTITELPFTLTTQEQLLALSRIVSDATKAEAAYVFRITGNTNNEVITYTPQREVRLPLEGGIFTAITKTEKSVNVANTESDAKFDKSLDELLQVISKHALAAPIVNAEGTLSGIILALNRSALTPVEQSVFQIEEGFTDFDEGILNALSRPVGKYISDVDALNDAKKESQQQRSMLELAKELSSVLDLFSLIRLVMDQARDILNADRCALFLVDHQAGELWAPVADGGSVISFPIGSGIAGFVADSGTVVNIPDAYADERFNKDIDVKTGYRTRSILCMPVFNREGMVIGVTQMLNKKNGQPFTSADESLLDMYSTFSGIGLQNSQLYNASIREQRKARVLLEVSSALSSSLDLNSLIAVIMDSAKQLLNADRCTLFLKSEDGKELWSRVADGTMEIRIPVDAGIAGHVATTGEILNIPDAYEHPLFNKGVDTKTGYRTKSILCMPIRDNDSKIIGVAQMINKKASKQSLSSEKTRMRAKTVDAMSTINRGQTLPSQDGASGGGHGAYLPFSHDDIELLSAFASQAAISIVNCALYTKTAEMSSYLESVLNSIKSGVVTINIEGQIVTSNSQEVLSKTAAIAGIKGTLEGLHYSEWLCHNQVIMEAVSKVEETNQPTFGYQYVFLEAAAAAEAEGTQSPDGQSPAKLKASAQEKGQLSSDQVHINFMVHPLINENHERTGIVLVLEDISPQQKMMLTLSRYMSVEKAEQVMSDEGMRLGGVSQKTTILFSDIRGYTKMSEFHEPAHVVQTLNEYFEHMAGAVLDAGGIIDKYIGDAIMAVFGCPFPKHDDALRAVRAAVIMKHGVREFNMERQEQGLDPILNIGVGVSTGDVVSGNIGTAQRMEYTVIGHAVNLASRVEGCTKIYGVGVLISEYTYQECKEHFVCREVDFVRVVGAAVPVHMYEVLVSRLDDICLSQAVLDNYDLWRVAIKDYRNCNFMEAKANFAEFARRVPGDKPAEMHVQRCIDFLKKAPPTDWDCSHDLRSKG